MAYNPLGGCQGVGAGKLVDRQRDRGLAVERAGLVVLLRTELQPGDVAQADDADRLAGIRVLRGAGRGAVAAALADLENDVAELRGIGQPAEGVDGQLELLAQRDGLLADLAGRDLQVLLADGEPRRRRR